MHIPASRKLSLSISPFVTDFPTVAPTVYVDGKVLKTVSSFAYLVPIVSNRAKMDKEIEFRIRKSISAFNNLYHKLWNSHDLSLTVEVNVYEYVGNAN